MKAELGTEKDLEEILDLRYRILRAPWLQDRDSATDELENESINAILRSHSGKLIACGRLQKNTAEIGQIRFMAVDQTWQGKGLGKLILKRLEEEAKNWGLKKIELQARENAVDFYTGQGYLMEEKSFLLWGQIQHYKMGKQLLHLQNPHF